MGVSSKSQDLTKRIQPKNGEHKNKKASKPSIANNPLAKALNVGSKVSKKENPLLARVGLEPLTKIADKQMRIKGAGSPKILQIKNLAPGTSKADIDTVIESTIGKVKYSKVRYFKVMNAAVAEVIFEGSYRETEKKLKQGLKQFHNCEADGKILQAEIVTAPILLTNKDLLKLNSAR